ncbi:methyltransferase domain-containing protein [Pseudonocardia sp. GCM10023141]|uniref:methyltransferase domain-containing protein n=1 Tax=Pseudonocardia sp. GCM10023141 TaxID=3252653 RepID=UPI0036174D36
MTGDGYLLDNAQAAAGTRLQALSELFDASTFRHFDAVGLTAGWRVWEVGAGGPDVSRRLADRVGPTGRVVASDIDVSWLPEGKGFEVLRHDVAADPPPAGGFDLVHARLVLVHLPRREQALASMVTALRPGGVLLVEDADPVLQPLLCPDEFGPEQELANRLRRGFRELLAARDADLAFGRTLPRLLRAAGLVDVGADAYFPITAPAATVLELATVDQVADRLVAAGIATTAELDLHRANLRAGRVPDLATSPMISAWGRR